MPVNAKLLTTRKRADGSRSWTRSGHDEKRFHSLLLHASEPNLSDQNRRVDIFSYKTPGLRYVGKGQHAMSILVHDVTPSLV